MCRAFLLYLFMQHESHFNELREKRNTPEFKVQIAGFLLLVLTSFSFFLRVGEKITFVLLCISFASYPISELISLFRKKEKYIFKINYILIFLNIIMLACCFIAMFDLDFLLYAGSCFSINLTISIFKGFFISKTVKE